MSVRPIERDEDMDRTYIPLPGGWEIQTRGKGSTFRICDPQGDRLPVEDTPYLHDTLERMARDIHAASSAPTAGAAALGTVRLTGWATDADLFKNDGHARVFGHRGADCAKRYAIVELADTAPVSAPTAEGEEAAKWHEGEATVLREVLRCTEADAGFDRAEAERDARYHDLAARALRQPQVTEGAVNRWAREHRAEIDKAYCDEFGLPDGMDRELLFAALGEVIDRIEACGASPALTHASTLACDLRQAIGNQYNKPNPYDLVRVKEAVGPHNTWAARCEKCGREWVAVYPVGTRTLACPGCNHYNDCPPESAAIKGKE